MVHALLRFAFFKKNKDTYEPIVNNFLKHRTDVLINMSMDIHEDYTAVLLQEVWSWLVKLKYSAWILKNAAETQSWRLSCESHSFIFIYSKVLIFFHNYFEQ